MNNLIIYLVVNVLFFPWQQKNAQKINRSYSHEQKQTIITYRDCLTTITNNKICNLDNEKLIEEIKYIEKKNISFKASPDFFNNKVAIVKPNPISSNINDYENLEYLFSKSDYLKILTIKSSYSLWQEGSRFVVRTYKLFNLEPETQYIFEADCFVLKTASEFKSIVVIKNVTKV